MGREIEELWKYDWVKCICEKEVVGIFRRDNERFLGEVQLSANYSELTRKIFVAGSTKKLIKSNYYFKILQIQVIKEAR